MLLDLAESLTPLLKARHERVSSQQGILRDGFDEEESSDTTLTILFLDGEEAFHDWTDTDSIYGARHLSQLWQDTYPDPEASDRLGRRRYDPIPTYIETIDHFILLDLLGNSHSRLYSYYRETDWLFDQMADVDRRLQEEGLVEVEKGESDWFQKARMMPGMIGDDHLPVCSLFPLDPLVCPDSLLSSSCPCVLPASSCPSLPPSCCGVFELKQMLTRSSSIKVYQSYT